MGGGVPSQTLAPLDVILVPFLNPIERACEPRRQKPPSFSILGSRLTSHGNSTHLYSTVLVPLGLARVSTPSLDVKTRTITSLWTWIRKTVHRAVTGQPKHPTQATNPILNRDDHLTDEYGTCNSESGRLGTFNQPN